MSEFIVAKGETHRHSLYKFTNGKYYEVISWESEDYAEIYDDNLRRCYVRVGQPTLRLAGNGRFERVSEHMSNALKIAKNAEKLTISIGSNKINVGSLDSEPSLAERLAKSEKERDQHKQDCIKAEAVIDQLYDMFPQVRNSDQLISAIRTAKIFSDAFQEMQKIR